MNNDSLIKVIIALWKFVNKEIKLPLMPRQTPGLCLYILPNMHQTPLQFSNRVGMMKNQMRPFCKVIPVVRRIFSGG
jgi:hypothetical protein